MEYPIIDIFESAYIRNNWTGLNNTSILPSGYTELEYIENSGTQYIDTEICPNSNTKIEMFSYINAYVGGTNKQLYNARGNNKYYGCSFVQGNRFNHYYGNYWDSISSQLQSPINLHIIQNRNNIEINANNIEITNERPNYDFVSDFSLYIFGANNAGNLYEPINSMKLYNFKIWENGDILSRNYIPCKRISDNNIGLYDTVTNEFYNNRGTDTFIAGEEIISGIDIIDFVLRLPLPLIKCYPLLNSLQKASVGTQTEEDTEILRHYLTPLGIGGI